MSINAELSLYYRMSHLSILKQSEAVISGSCWGLVRHKKKKLERCTTEAHVQNSIASPIVDSLPPISTISVMHKHAVSPIAGSLNSSIKNSRYKAFNGFWQENYYVFILELVSLVPHTGSCRQDIQDLHFVVFIIMLRISCMFNSPSFYSTISRLP